MSSPKTTAAVALAISAIILTAFHPDGGPRTTTSCTTVLDSEVCAWITMDGDRPTELGATVPIDLIEAVPPDAPMVWPPQELASIELPDVARTALGVQRFGINWEAHGHPPATFATPHFDFHFYSITSTEVAAIDCADQSKPSVIPEGYTLPDITIPDMGTLVGLCVPLMGMHAVPTPDMTATEPFGATMIFGYYAGHPIFFEPMVSQALLLERKDFSLPMPAVEGLGDDVRYPRSFEATYDADAGQYRLLFTRFES